MVYFKQLLKTLHSVCILLFYPECEELFKKCCINKCVGLLTPRSLNKWCYFSGISGLQGTERLLSLTPAIIVRFKGPMILISRHDYHDSNIALLTSVRPAADLWPDDDLWWPLTRACLLCSAPMSSCRSLKMSRRGRRETKKGMKLDENELNNVKMRGKSDVFVSLKKSSTL